MKYRSTEEELMDDPSLPKDQLEEALTDIKKVNQWLGGNKIISDAVRKIIKKNNCKEFYFVDLGCGDGEILRLLVDVLRKEHCKVKCLGIDFNIKSIDNARQLSKSYPEITFRAQNILELDTSKFTCDLIICNLTLHHFDNKEIPIILKKYMNIPKYGILINDLHRSSIAYHLFKLFSIIFIKGDIAKTDGLISIQRGFKKHELKSFFIQIGIKDYKINWKWAFRYLIEIRNQISMQVL